MAHCVFVTEEAPVWSGDAGRVKEDKLQWTPVAHGADVLLGLPISTHTELQALRAGLGYLSSLL